jgi:hypothetical protein
MVWAPRSAATELSPAQKAGSAMRSRSSDDGEGMKGRNGIRSCIFDVYRGGAMTVMMMMTMVMTTMMVMMTTIIMMTTLTTTMMIMLIMMRRRTTTMMTKE